MNTLKAAIDFGTNTARLLIAECNDGVLGTIHCLEREIVRMGGGFTRENGLSDEAIERGCVCLKRFASIIRKYPVDTVYAVATSAVRDALNSDMFLSLIKDETGIDLQVIDGVQEGRLTLQGVLSGLDCSYDSLLLFDVGGGSTEYTLVQCGKPVFIKSLPLGVVRLTESKSSIEAMVDKIIRELQGVQSEMEHQKIDWNADVLIGTAGTATTLAAISMHMADYDYRRVNNSTLELSDVCRIYDQLAPLSLPERLQIPGLEKGREDLIIAGSLITIKSMEMFGYSTMKVSDYGLLEGLLVAGDAVG